MPKEKQDDIIFRDDNDIEMSDDIDIDFVDDDDEGEPVGGDKGQQRESGDDDGGSGGSEDTRAELERMRQQLADAQAQMAALAEEGGKHAQKSVEWQLAFAEEKDASIESQMKDLRRQLVKAEEEGETEKKHEIEDKITELRETRTKLHAARDSIKANMHKKPEPVKKDEGERGVEPEGQDWIKRNTWFNNPQTEEDAVKRLYVIQADKDLLKDSKFKLGTRAYYDELDRRVSQKMKERSNQGQPTRKQRSPVNQAPSGEGNRPKNKTTVQITPEDRAVMRKMGLNDRDPEHLKEFARNKKETDADTGDRPSAKFPVRK